jgi:hypothetical protein
MNHENFTIANESGMTYLNDHCCKRRRTKMDNVKLSLYRRYNGVSLFFTIPLVGL